MARALELRQPEEEFPAAGTAAAGAPTKGAAAPEPGGSEQLRAESHMADLPVSEVAAGRSHDPEEATAVTTPESRPGCGTAATAFRWSSMS